MQKRKKGCNKLAARRIKKKKMVVSSNLESKDAIIFVSALDKIDTLSIVIQSNPQRFRFIVPIQRPFKFGSV